jgi:hypothetical protein
MVKIAAVFVLLVLFAIPVMAQDDYPRIQTSLGYANLGLLDFGSVNFDGSLTGATSRHSGFANETGFNFTRSLGVNNYLGVYGLGGNVTMLADFIGGKAMYRTQRAVPYGLAGLGFAYLTSGGLYGYGSSFATRFGGGVDVPFNDVLAFKVEVSRMSFHLQTNPLAGASWVNGINIQTGIVFTIAQ